MRSSRPAPLCGLIAPTDIESASPTEECDQPKRSDDWQQWDTVDPALIRFTLEASDSLERRSHTERQTDGDTKDKIGTARQDIISTVNIDVPFHKWMKTLRRRAARRYTTAMDEVRFDFPDLDDCPQTTNGLGHLHRRMSSSGSSMGFVEAVKTASVSLASGSIFARSRRNSMRSSRTRTQTDRSSRASTSSNRCSEDSAGLDKPRFLDKAAVERSLQRRRILEELISTEEGYIGDVRFLMNVSRPLPLGTLSTLLTTQMTLGLCHDPRLTAYHASGSTVIHKPESSCDCRTT